MDSIRFTGLASGMDTQSIVDNMMRAKRMPLDRLKQDKQVFQWQRDNYREMSKLLKEFDQFLFDGIYRESNMLKRTVTSSNSDLVSATASAGKGDVSFSISKVESLATAARLTSSGSVGDIDPSKSLWSQKDKFGTAIPWKQEDVTDNFRVPEGKTASTFRVSKAAASDFPASGETITVKDQDGNDLKSYTVVTDEAALESTPDSVYINQDTGVIKFSEELAENSKFSLDYKQNFVAFNIETNKADGTRQSVDGGFKFTADSSLDKIFEKINGSSAGINMFFDEGTQRIVATRNDTGNLGTEAEIQFTDPDDPDADSAFFTDVLKMTEAVDGTDAKFTLNGLETTRKSNSFTINNVTVNLNGTFNKEGADVPPISISSATDTEGIMETVTSFVDKYNELIGKVNGKLTEEQFKSFKPLTEEQKANMSEKEIEIWEEKAKSGLIRRDSILTGGLGKLRMDMYTQVSGNTLNSKFNQLAEIGITTSKDYLERGKLEINTEKLKAAIEEDPEGVYELFMADGDKHGEKGIARRLRDSVEETMVGIREKAGSTGSLTNEGHMIGKQINRIDNDIDSYERRLKMVEERLWDQFNAMEKAMQRMNEQSAQLMSQLGMGGAQG